ncbi:MAG: TetR/AcrR family transcriptional regulator; helix-turn-helix transcriptional regulator [Chitinophagales bacterium]|nr:TetR/AcrR family transcriptional regulator [Chitinophagales bacterium]MCZ2392934.1 TetR/AcrR family transcriptional regulator; helix-turn-helix transcriptional regulator [Chitinophagales bacterium]
MPKQKVSVDYILKQSLRLFRKKSYHNTSIADIAEACGLLKGSLYHYFPSKEALMIAVIKYAHAYFNREVFAIAYNEELDAQQKMEQMFKKSERALLSDGDIMGNIGVETARVIPEFSESIRDFFEDWIKAVKVIFMQITNEEDALRLAEQTVTEFEGAVMMSRIFKDPKFVHNAYDRLTHRFAAFGLNPQN